MKKPLPLVCLFVCHNKGWIKKCTQHEVAGKQECGRPRKTWQQCLTTI